MQFFAPLPRVTDRRNKCSGARVGASKTKTKTKTKDDGQDQDQDQDHSHLLAVEYLNHKSNNTTKSKAMKLNSISILTLLLAASYGPFVEGRVGSGYQDDSETESYLSPTAMPSSVPSSMPSVLKELDDQLEVEPTETLDSAPGPPSSFSDFCWLDAYGRGIGTIPSECPPDKVKIGLLCYSKCPSGYARFGFDCHQICPDGFRDDGLFCRKAEYGRGAGYPWKFGDPLNNSRMIRRCEADYGKGKCEAWGAVVYPK
jgi:hypothetical protein